MMQRKKTLLIGSGGHAVSLLENFYDNIAGYLDFQPTRNLNIEWVGSDEKAPFFANEGYDFHIAVIYSKSPDMRLRRAIIEKYGEFEAAFKTFISSSALVSRGSEVGEGCAIMAGAILNKATLSRHVVANSGSVIEHDVEIGENVFIGPGAVIGGGTKIGKDCFIGLGAKVRNGINISDNVTVGMGSIVTKDILKPGLYYGII